MKKLIRYFIQGLIVVAPISITIYVIVQLFKLLDSFNPYNIPGLGLLLTLATITLVGFVSIHYINDRIFDQRPHLRLV